MFDTMVLSPVFSFDHSAQLPEEMIKRAEMNHRLRERLYFARNTGSRNPATVLGTTSIYINLMCSSAKGVQFGNDFLSLPHQIDEPWIFALPVTFFRSCARHQLTICVGVVRQLLLYLGREERSRSAST